MIKKFQIIRTILRHKNRQLRIEREKMQAQESMNVILSAYLALLAEKKGTVTIPKREVSEALGKYRVSAHSSGDDYIITVTENVQGESNGSTI